VTWVRWAAGGGIIDNVVWTDCTAPSGAQAGGPYNVAEGGSVALSGSGAGSSLSYNWDFTGNSVYNNASGTNPTFSAATSAGSALDGATTHTVGLQVTSSSCSGTSTDTATINVSNVAPTASASIPSSGVEGSSVSFSSSATDPGPDSFSYSWTFGDGVTSTSQNPSHTYDDNGSYTVTVNVSDGDGGVGTVTSGISISNAPPVIGSISGASSPVEGDTESYSATVTDPSGADTTAGFTYAWTLTDTSGGSLTSSSPTPSFLFADDDLYVLSLTVTDKDGGSDTESTNINVSNANPVASISGPTSGNEGQTLTFVGSATDPGADTFTYAWTFGDGGSASGQTVSHTYVDEGTGSYTVTLTVNDDDSGSDTETQAVAISNVNPNITLFSPPGVGSEGSSLNFTSTASDAGTQDTLSYSWSFGDGSSSTSQTTTHTYADNGSYAVSLTVTDGDGGSDTSSTTLPISNVNPTISSFSGATSTTEGATETYGAVVTDPSSTDTTAGFTYSWTLTGSGPTQTSSSATPSFTFADDGTFTLALTVTDKDGGSDTSSISITVANVNPVASISGPTSGNEGQSLAFTGSATDAGADTFTYAWSFGDGASATGPSVSHTYADEGTGSYTVTLTVTDDDGGSDTTTQAVAVANVDPTIDSFTVPGSGVEAGILSFTSTASDVGTLDTLSYLWDFGDSTTSTSQNPTHAYADEGTGTYTVTLTVTDNDGGSATTSATTSIANVNPVAGAIVGPNTGVEGQPLSWTGSGSDVGTLDTLTYSWDYGDGTSTTTGTSATHTYLNDGTFTITLTVTDNDGGTDTSTLVVTIQNLPPTVTSVTGPTTGDEGSTLAFFATGTDPGPIDQANLTWSWDWDDGTPNGIGAGTSHAWDDEGTFTVEATVADPSGLTGSDTLVVTINNVAPTIVTSPGGFADEGVLYSYSANATDPGADTITWSLSTSSPAGASVNPGTGLVEWTPTFAQLGQQTFTLTADDGDGGTDVQSWTVQVGFTDSDGDGMADTWEVANGLDPTVDDSTLDPDGDGLTNLDEFLNGQDPNVSDLPDPPVLVDPIAGAEIDDPRPDLSWDAAVDPNGDPLTYSVEVYEDQAMSLLVTWVDGVPDLSWPIDTQLRNENADYFWRARAHDGWGYGIWSDLEDFFLNEYNEAPGPPTLTYPVDSETIGTLTPSPEMIEGVDVDRDDVNHRVRIWSTDGIDMLTEGWIPAAARNVSWAIDIVLEEDTWYAWEAQAEDEHGLTSDWTELEDFFATSENAPPLDVHFVDPRDGDHVESTSPDLTYTESVDPEGRTIEYEIDLDTSAGFDSVEFISVTLEHQDTGSATWALSDDGTELAENLWWNARVRAIDQEDGTSAWDVIAFFVRGDNDPPHVPVLISPADGSTLTERTPILAVAHSIDPEEDLVFYEILVTRDAEGTQTLTSTDGLIAGAGPEGTADQTSWRTEANLEGTVYWTARAVDDRGAASEWADPWMLVLDTGEPIALEPDGLLTGGCESCASSVSGSPARGLWAALLLPLVLFRRRRS
jgi:PKD repeat protein